MDRFTSWVTEALMCMEVFTSLCLPRCCQMSPGFVMGSQPSSPPSASSPSVPSTGNWKLPENSWSKFLQCRKGCSCAFPPWFPAASRYECQTPAFPLKRPNKAFTWSVSYSAAFFIPFSWPFEWIKKLSDICTWGKSQQLTLYANSESL